MTKYLNNFVDSKLAYTHDPYLIVTLPVQGDDEFEDYMEWDRLDGRLWINKYFLEGFMKLFAIEKTAAQQFISDWFSKRFDVEVKFVE